MPSPTLISHSQRRFLISGHSLQSADYGVFGHVRADEVALQQVPLLIAGGDADTERVARDDVTLSSRGPPDGVPGRLDDAHTEAVAQGGGAVTSVPMKLPCTLFPDALPPMMSLRKMETPCRPLPEMVLRVSAVVPPSFSTAKLPLRWVVVAPIWAEHGGHPPYLGQGSVSAAFNANRLNECPYRHSERSTTASGLE